MKSGIIASAILFAISGITSATFPATQIVLPGKVAAGWFAGWHESQFPASQVPWNRYTHVTYAFAVTTSDTTKLDESGLTGLPTFVSEARKNGVRPLVSIGGWTGSRYFSNAVASAPNRTAFVKTVTDLAVKYRVDGLDFDWEYPDEAGSGCNKHGPGDTPNFLLFLEQLRTHPVGKLLAVTVAAGISPWLGTNGEPLKDVSGFAKVVDYVAIMNYDIWGPWSPTVGPNAPLYDSCAPKADQGGSASSAVEAWTKAGMPSNKLALGVPSYGHSYRVLKKNAYSSNGQLALFPPFVANDQPAGDKWDSQPGGPGDCGGAASTQPGGVIEYWGMIQLGYINTNGNPEPGRTYRFDTCSKTSFIYDPTKQIMVSYDDPQSMRAKGQFIGEQKLRGFSLWEVGGDYHTSLVDAIRSTY